MAFGFPAYHTERYSRANPIPDIRNAVRETLGALSWSLRDETHDRIIASTGTGMRSWGERVFIDFLPDNAISVTSRCRAPTQCVDWGKNRANIRQFMAELEKHT